jgi:RNA polymerase sigma factor (sigma-70 family)
LPVAAEIKIDIDSAIGEPFMSSTPLLALVARCRSLCRARSQAPDSALLSRFVQQRDAAAFEELLERYAPLVWGVCRRIAPTESDSEDAFQATFLALVRQAGRLDDRQPLGGWLHAIAVRIARKTATRARKQSPRATIPEPIAAGDIADEVGSRELFRLVDEEIERLPALLRQPLLLCCLQGRTRDEAAETLGCSIAAVKSRLERGRDLLRRRLERRGVQFPVAFLVLGLTGERIRAGLWAKTMQSALHTPAPELIALAEGSVFAGTMGKSKWILAAIFFVSSAAGAVHTLRTETPAETPASPQAKAAEGDKKAEVPREHKDRHGDPLPEGAIARLGTVRWRHGFGVSALAYSPDGRKIAAIGAGRALTLWDAATGKELRPFPNINQPIGLAFSPDGRTIATTDNPFCYLWDVATGKELRRLEGHQNVVQGVAFSPDGKKLATAGSDGTVRLWDPATGKELRRIDCQPGDVWRIAYSPDGKSIASTSTDGTIHFWDPETGKEQRHLSGHKKGICSIVFSRDGKRLASSSQDGTIRLWDTATGRQSHILIENLEEDVTPIAFSPDGALLASGHQDGTIRLWDVEKGTEKRHWKAGELPVRGIAFSPDGKTLASGVACGNIRLWDVATGRERYPSEEPHGYINEVRFASDGATLISLSRDRRILWWDLATQTPRRQFTWTAKGGIHAALSPDGNTLAVGSWSDYKARVWETRLWDVRTGKPSRLLDKHPGGFWPIAFSPDGRFVASGGREHVIYVWDASTGKEVRQIKDVADEVWSLCFSPDSKALACGTYPEGIVTAKPALHLWDLDSGKERCQFNMHFSFVTGLAFSPDGKVIASGDRSREGCFVHLWDTTSGRELCCHTGHREDVGALVFSPDGKLVASGAGSIGQKDNSVHVWEAATGRLIRRFEGHHSCVGSVAFSPDGLTVASGAGDATILLWDITGRRSDGRWHAKPLTAREWDAFWSELVNEDAAKAYVAVWQLVAAPEQAVPFLRKNLTPVPRPDAKTVARWIADLDSDIFAVRQKANDELSTLDDAITPVLRGALQGKPSLETRRRVQQLLDQAHDWTPEHLRDHRAIQALEHIGTSAAREVLHTLAAGVPEARRTEEARASLQRLQQR